MPLQVFRPRGPIQYHAPIVPPASYLPNVLASCACPHNERPFEGLFIGSSHGGVDSTGTTPTAVKANAFSAENNRPFAGAAFALRGAPDPDPPPRSPGPLIIKPRVPDLLFEGRAFSARGGVSTVDVTVTPRTAFFFKTESPPAYPGFVLQTIGKPVTVDTVRPVLAPIIAQTESPPLYSGAVVLGRGGPDLVTAIPVVTRIVMAQRENAPLWPGLTMMGHGGPAAVTTDPVPPRFLQALREEMPPEAGYLLAPRVISAWFEYVPPPAIMRQEPPQPYQGSATYSHAFPAVTVQDPTPRVMVAKVEEPPPYPGFVVTCSRTGHWATIIVITPSMSENFVMDSR